MRVERENIRRRMLSAVRGMKDRGHEENGKMVNQNKTV